MAGRRTSAKDVSLASKVLLSKTATKAEKSVAGIELSQRSKGTKKGKWPFLSLFRQRIRV